MVALGAKRFSHASLHTHVHSKTQTNTLCVLLFWPHAPHVWHSFKMLLFPILETNKKYCECLLLHVKVQTGCCKYNQNQIYIRVHKHTFSAAVIGCCVAIAYLFYYWDKYLCLFGANIRLHVVFRNIIKNINVKKVYKIQAINSPK